MVERVFRALDGGDAKKVEKKLAVYKKYYVLLQGRFLGYIKLFIQ